MKSGNIIPAATIATHVDRILVIESATISSPFILPLYANGVPTLLFKSVKGKLGKENASHLLLFGQTVLPELLTLPAAFTLIAYFFKPYTLMPLFNVAALELTDRPIDLNLLFPHTTAELQEQLLNADSVKDMIGLLDGFILKLINQQKNECALIKYATTKIAGDHSKKSLAFVQKELHITERTFQRLFERNVGIAPNLYRRICQFNAAFTELSKSRPSKLSGIAYQYGYADQSHYIRAFKEFTAITPAAYLRFGSEHQS